MTADTSPPGAFVHSGRTLALPTVPAGPRAGGIRAANDKADQPHDQSDQGDPPQCMDHETEPAQQQNYQENKK
jgi:hypothetical protein